jgi:hypothetical protein
MVSLDNEKRLFRTSRVPATVVELIYLISDEPRRAFALDIVLLPILAAAVQITAPSLTLLEFHSQTVWSAAGPVLAMGWLMRAIGRRIRN